MSLPAWELPEPKRLPDDVARITDAVVSRVEKLMDITARDNLYGADPHEIVLITTRRLERIVSEEILREVRRNAAPTKPTPSDGAETVVATKRTMHDSRRDGAEFEEAIRAARYELAALIPSPARPNTDEWPCTNPADQECLQKAYQILTDVLSPVDSNKGIGG